MFGSSVNSMNVPRFVHVCSTLRCVCEMIVDVGACICGRGVGESAFVCGTRMIRKVRFVLCVTRFDFLISLCVRTRASVSFFTRVVLGTLTVLAGSTELHSSPELHKARIKFVFVGYPGRKLTGKFYCTFFDG
ncbi:unnamed protein product [Scytosiphon promiscuus]